MREYTAEEIQQFLEDDKLDPEIAEELRRWLKSQGVTSETLTLHEQFQLDDINWVEQLSRARRQQE